MSVFGNKNNKESSGKKKRPLPLFSIILVACFVFIPLIFFLRGMQQAPGRIPAQETAEVPSEGQGVEPSSPPDAVITIEDTPVPMPPAVKVRGIYYIIEHSSSDNFERCLGVVEETNLNAIVIDVKDDYGGVTLVTENEKLKSAADYFRERTPGAIRISAETVADMKARGIYTIARIVCFRDNRSAIENPSFALKNKNGGVWLYGNNNNNRWIDPYNEDYWEYVLEVCKETAAIGFDEIQLDYVRFPTDGRVSDINYGAAADENNRYQIIDKFVSYIREEMRQLGVRTSADIFATVGLSYIDASIVGQNVQLLLGNLDSICPMIYPSHFSNVYQNGTGSIINGVLFEHPDLDPYGVVYNTLQHYTNQINEFKENNPGTETAIIRPYLQYFTANWLGEENFIEYGPDEVHAQIKAVTDAGFEEWILWTTSNGFDPAVIP